MISRTTTRSLAELVQLRFRKSHRLLAQHRTYYTTDTAAVYDFFFDHEFPGWFCNLAKRQWSPHDTRPIKEFVMRLHTGEAVEEATASWTAAQREKLGQELLRQLGAAMFSLDYSSGFQTEERAEIEDCRRRFELDGFVLKNGKLLVPESEVLDAAAEAEVLVVLFHDLKLEDGETTIHHLRLSEEHYVAERWDDSISNSRKFLESVLMQVATKHSMAVSKAALAEATMKKPILVREYLEKVELLEKQECKALAEVYGLLSRTGGHPYMAASDQARLLRHLALTFSQFVMLRLQGALV